MIAMADLGLAALSKGGKESVEFVKTQAQNSSFASYITKTLVPLMQKT